MAAAHATDPTAADGGREPTAADGGREPTAADGGREPTAAASGRDPMPAGGAVAVRLAHGMAGRLRLRLAGALAPGEAGALADRLAACPGVARVRARPGTGSVIVEGAGTAEAILARLVGAGAIRVLPPLKAPPVGMVARAGLAALDHQVARRSEGALDLHSTLALLLALGAVVQALRGQVAGPATTLAMSALALLEGAQRR